MSLHWAAYDALAAPFSTRLDIIPKGGEDIVEDQKEEINGIKDWPTKAVSTLKYLKLLKLQKGLIVVSLFVKEAAS